jgi:dolichol-phosphate mannosyltransferase
VPAPPENGEICRLSVVVPSLNEARNLDILLPHLRAALDRLGVPAEILVVDHPAGDSSEEVARRHGAVYIAENKPGYGAAILRGAREAAGSHIITMDADLSHPARFIESLWEARDAADIVIASRYVEGGRADQPRLRLWLSRLLNAVFRAGLALEVRDLSSGFRLYHREIFDAVRPECANFAVLVEILLLALARGFRVMEVPFHYQPRRAGRSNARILHFGLDYVRLFHRMRRLRNRSAQSP